MADLSLLPYLSATQGYPGKLRLRFRRAIQKVTRGLVAAGTVRRVKVLNINSAGKDRRYRALQLVHASTSTAEKKTVEGEDDEEVVAEDDAEMDEADPNEADMDDEEDGDVTVAAIVTHEVEIDGMDEYEDVAELVDEGEVMAVPGTWLRFKSDLPGWLSMDD